MTIENNRVQYHHNYLITEARHTSQTRKVKPAYACMDVQINTYVLTFLLFLRTSYEYRVYTLILKKFSRGRADAYKEKTRCRYGLSDRFKAGQNQLKARQSRKNRYTLAFSSQNQIQCQPGQEQGSWRVFCPCLKSVTDFGRKLARYT